MIPLWATPPPLGCWPRCYIGGIKQTAARGYTDTGGPSEPWVTPESWTACMSPLTLLSRLAIKCSARTPTLTWRLRDWPLSHKICQLSVWQFVSDWFYAFPLHTCRETLDICFMMDKWNASPIVRGRLSACLWFHSLHCLPLTHDLQKANLIIEYFSHCTTSWMVWRWCYLLVPDLQCSLVARSPLLLYHLAPLCHLEDKQTVLFAGMTTEMLYPAKIPLVLSWTQEYSIYRSVHTYISTCKYLQFHWFCTGMYPQCDMSFETYTCQSICFTFYSYMMFHLAVSHSMVLS